MGLLSATCLKSFKNKHFGRVLQVDVMNLNGLFSLCRFSSARHRNGPLRDSLLLYRFLIVILVINAVTPVISGERRGGFETQESITINKPVMRSSDREPWAYFSSDYVRCFCNLPACVSTGYMCKSKEGSCFSDLRDTLGSQAENTGKHGCTELLSNKEQKDWCQLGESSKKRKFHSKKLLLCCYEDMCNHIDSPETKNLMNSTLTIHETIKAENPNRDEHFGYSNSEVWFRAATIAVPICGAVILFVLIALAVKILRTEHRNSYNHKLGPAMYVHHVPSSKPLEKCYFDQNYMRRQFPTHSLYNADFQRHVPLLLQNEINTYHNDNKNATNAKMNLVQADKIGEYLESEHIILEIEKPSMAESSHVNLDKNFNSDDVKYSNIKYDDKTCE